MNLMALLFKKRCSTTTPSSLLDWKKVVTFEPRGYRSWRGFRSQTRPCLRSLIPRYSRLPNYVGSPNRREPVVWRAVAPNTRRKCSSNAHHLGKNAWLFPSATIFNRLKLLDIFYRKGLSSPFLKRKSGRRWESGYFLVFAHLTGRGHRTICGEPVIREGVYLLQWEVWFVFLGVTPDRNPRATRREVGRVKLLPPGGFFLPELYPTLVRILFWVWSFALEVVIP